MAIWDAVEVGEHGEFSSVALPIWKIVWHFPANLKMWIPYDPVIPLLNRTLEEFLFTFTWKLMQKFSEQLWYNRPKWKQVKCSSNTDWMNKSWDMHILKCCITRKMKKLQLHISTRNSIKIVLSEEVDTKYIQCDSISTKFQTGKAKQCII